jgi:hypothetical protein
MPIFAAAAGDHLGNDAVEADGGKRSGEEAEEAGQRSWAKEYNRRADKAMRGHNLSAHPGLDMLSSRLSASSRQNYLARERIRPKLLCREVSFPSNSHRGLLRAEIEAWPEAMLCAVVKRAPFRR